MLITNNSETAVVSLRSTASSNSIFLLYGDVEVAYIDANTGKLNFKFLGATQISKLMQLGISNLVHNLDHTTIDHT